MRKRIKKERILALLLALILVAGLLPVSVFASVGDGGDSGSESGGDSGSGSGGDGGGGDTPVVTEQVTVTVNAEGDAGTVTLDGTEQTSVTVDKDAEVEVVLTPSANAYIKSLSIDGVEAELPEKGQPYTGAVTAGKDTAIDVTFMETYAVTTEVIDGLGGSISLAPANEDDTFGDRFDKDSAVTVTVTPTQTAAETYRVRSVAFDGTEESIADAYEPFIKEITVTNDAAITAEFERYYTVTVTYDQNGTVITDPPGTDADGTVTVYPTTEGVEVTATPNENYRVSGVTIDGVEMKLWPDVDPNPNPNLYDKDNPYLTTLSAEQDHAVTVTFAPVRHQVTVSVDGENGAASISGGRSTWVDHNETATVTVRPNPGYTLDTVTVGGNALDLAGAVTVGEKDALAVSLGSITKDVTVSVSFREAVVYGETATDVVTFNSDAAVRSDTTGATSDLYVFRTGTSITFTAQDAANAPTGLRLTFEGGATAGDTEHTSVPVTETATVVKTEVWFEYVWHEVPLGKPIEIVIDEETQAPTVTPDRAPDGTKGYYNADVTFTVTAADAYAGLKSVEYWITKDGIEGAHEALYTKEADGDTLLSWTNADAPFTVNAAANDSDDVILYVRATDQSNNDATTEIPLKFCTAAPEVAVNISGTTAAGATAGYYNAARTATITITEPREGTFDAEGAALTLTSAPEGVALPELEWTEDPADPKIHTASVTFGEEAGSKNGLYEWSFSYTSGSGLSDEDIAATGTDPWSFRVDTAAPTARLKADEATFWDKLLTALSFGTFRKEPIRPEVSDITDNLSPADGCSVGYYYDVDDPDRVMNETELAGVDFQDEPIQVSGEGKYVIYAKVTDQAGNVLYLSTDGMVIDTTRPAISVTAPEPNAGEFYTQDFTVTVDVNDPVSPEGTDVFSGVKRVYYELVVDADGEAPQRTDPVTLYPAEGQEASPDVNEVTGLRIDLRAAEFNSDDVQVVVTAEDFAGNVWRNVKTETEQDVVETHLKITTAKPVLAVEFDAPVTTWLEEDGSGFINTDRTATITVTDLAAAFNADAATAMISEGITAVDGAGASVQTPFRVNTWSAEGESWDGQVWKTQGDVHTATITFFREGHYTWDLGTYENEAGIAYDKEAVTTQATDAPFQFTIDKTVPAGQTSDLGRGSWESVWTTPGYTPRSSSISIELENVADDVSSPETIQKEYYRTSEPMTQEALEQARFTAYEGPVTLSTEGRTLVYFRLTDQAGNVRYLRSGGYHLDFTDPTLSLSAPRVTAAEQNGIHNAADGNIMISVSAGDSGTGVGGMRYTVESNGRQTQSGSLSGGRIEVDRALNNACNVTVRVQVNDQAGNTTSQSVTLDIDITPPAVDLTFDNNQDNGGNGFFHTPRTATLVVTEREEHFDREAAMAGVVVTAVDSAGQPVADAWHMSSWSTASNDADPNAATHTATITFDKDANYTLAFSCVDKANNPNSEIDTHDSTAPFAFTVDTAAPAGWVKAVSAEGQEKTWTTLTGPDELTFGFWSREGITVTASGTDPTSPLAGVEYYKQVAREGSDATAALSVAQLDQINDWQEFTTLEVTEDQQFVVYLKLTDRAGNYAYLSTGGLIVDQEAPREETIAPVVTVEPEQPVNGFYRGDVSVSIQVDDPLTGGTYSGLNEVSYKVFDHAVSDVEPTQEGVLFSFDADDPKQVQLVRSWKGEITVESQRNNSNDVEIVVYASDNALNTSNRSERVKIDVTAPAIEVRYDNNRVDSETFFNADRVATIVVTERNFDPEQVTLEVTNTQGAVPTLSPWVEAPGTGNRDDATWTATLPYVADGDYTFAITCADLAGNPAGETSYAEGTAAPTTFTVDKTLPTISVSYDNNAARNENYFDAPRTATVTIRERNFVPERAQIALTATEDGAGVGLPAVSGWSGTGDVHTATIRYTGDAHYTFDVDFTDNAGNPAADFAAEEFYIDQTPPALEISGVAERTAYPDEVIPVIAYSDVNLDQNNVTLTLTGANQGALELDGAFLNGRNGQTFTFNNFPEEQSADDIYTLEATVSDRAGNTSTQSVVFSVNRFGSTYDLSHESLQRVNGNYVQTPDDLVVSEINATELSDIKVTLFKNNRAQTLTEGTDYQVDRSGGDGQWYEYTYTISSANFQDDGLYSLVFHSEDETNRVAENTLDTKSSMGGSEISFVVDNTAPIVNVKNLESDVTYAQEGMTVELSASDNLKLQSVTVYLDNYDVPYQSWSDEEGTLTSDGTYQFYVEESGQARNVRVVVRDAAGQEVATEIDGFYVTTDLWIRFYNNKPLFYSSIGAAVAVVGGVTAGVVLRRKKKSKKKISDTEQ